MLPARSIECPYCGETIELVIDSSVEHQRYVEDCSVCCRPIEVEVTVLGPTEIRLSCGTDTEA
jgi:transcription elongation factor Elf1